MNLTISLALAALVSGLNIAGWAWVLDRLAKKPGPLLLMGLILFFTLKLGLTALALFLVIKSPWFNVVGLLVGLGLPVFGLVAWRGLKPASHKG